ncbi:MAG: NAD-dependent dehydratase, partial [Bacteroidota bacterium]
SESTIGEEINIATQSEISIKELAQTIIDQINPNATIVQDAQRMRPNKSEVYRLYGSNAKLKSLTDWELKYSFAEGIKETIEWFSDKSNLSAYKANIYNI